MGEVHDPANIEFIWFYGLLKKDHFCDSKTAYSLGHVLYPCLKLSRVRTNGFVGWHQLITRAEAKIHYKMVISECIDISSIFLKYLTYAESNNLCLANRAGEGLELDYSIIRHHIIVQVSNPAHWPETILFLWFSSYCYWRHFLPGSIQQ